MYRMLSIPYQLRDKRVQRLSRNAPKAVSSDVNVKVKVQSEYMVIMYLRQFGIVLTWSLLITGKNVRRIIPTTLDIREGEDMQIRLSKVFESEISCYVRTPQGIDCNLKIDVSDSCDPRINHWSENGECGARIVNVTRNDEGAWRLTSASDRGKRIVDVALVNVLEKYNATEITVPVEGGQPFTYVFPNAQRYCEIKCPHGQRLHLKTDECKLELDKPTASDDGRWRAIVGVHGQVQEIIASTNISVSRKNPISGFEWSADSKTARLYCNFPHNTIEFCRFTNLENNQTRLRLKDGLRKGRYGYYGRGFIRGDCGLSIESPRQTDFGQWHCLVGVEGDELPFGASMQIAPPTSTSEANASAHVRTKSWSTSPVITTIGQYLKLECFANVPLTYCWLSQPNAELFSPDDTLAGSSAYKRVTYRNQGLSDGACSIVIAEAAKEHSGTWVCHMGPASGGVELAGSIAVRVTEAPFAAVDEIVVVERIGDPTILRCKTVPSITALEYCRFFGPTGVGLNVNEHATKEMPTEYNNIKYWYSGGGIKLGDCGLLIDSTQKEHLGEWTCAAKLQGHSIYSEIADTIQVRLSDESGTLTATASAGIGIAIVAVLGAAGLAVHIAVKRLRNQSNQRNNRPRLEVTEQMRLQRASLSSGSTSDSAVPSIN